MVILRSAIRVDKFSFWSKIYPNPSFSRPKMFRQEILKFIFSWDFWATHSRNLAEWTTFSNLSRRLYEGPSIVISGRILTEPLKCQKCYFHLRNDFSALNYDERSLKGCGRWAECPYHEHLTLEYSRYVPPSSRIFSEIRQKSARAEFIIFTFFLAIIKSQQVFTCHQL